MGRAKDIIVKVIPSKIANDFVKKWHYSGKVVPNSQLHFGCFLDNRLHGVMQFGPSMQKKEMISLVEGTKWNEFIELNRMAFDNILPKNSESRCIAIALRLIKKNAPHIRWVLSFADGCQCGDGTIYRASGFKLIQINNKHSMYLDDKGNVVAKMTILAHKPNEAKLFKNYKRLDGNMLEYIYIYNKEDYKKLTKEIIPFTKIDELNAGMYKGQKITRESRHNA